MVSIGVSDLTKILAEALSFRSKRQEYTRAQLMEFLEEVAKEARSLADTWNQLLTEITSSGIGNPSPRLRIPTSNAIPQYRIYTKLAVFYESATQVLGGRMDVTWRSGIFDTLAGLIHTRNLTRQQYDRLIKGLTSPILISGENGCAWQDIESAVMTLNKEAATLEALVISYKASSVT